MKKSSLIVTVLIVGMVLIGCASIAPPAPEDRQQFYLASPDEVDKAIRDYMFDHGVMILNEGPGMIRGEYENASLTTGVMTGGSVVSRLTFNYRKSGEGTDLRVSMLTDAGGRTSEPPAENYRQLFEMLGDYIDRGRSD